MIPAHAERIDFNAVMTTERRPSRYVPGIEALVATVRCPSCERTHEDPGINETIACPCGLFIRIGGMCAHIWRARPLQAVR